MAEVAHSSLPHSQHQVVHRRGGRVAVVPPPVITWRQRLLKPLIIRLTVLVRAQAVQQWVTVRDEHTESLYRRSFLSRERRWSVQASIGDSTSRMQPGQCPCGDVHPPDRLHHTSLLPRYSKVRTFSRISSPMLTLARVASAARRLAVFTAVSVRVPRRDR